MSNVDTARSAHQAFSRGDLAALKDSYAEDAVWYSSEEVRPGGEIHGRDAILDMMGRLPDHWSTVSVEPREYIDGGEYVVVLGTVRFANDNGIVETILRDKTLHQQHADRDGQVIGGTFLADRGGREIDHDALARITQTGVLDRGLHARTTLLHGFIGQTDDVGAGQTVGGIHFHFNDDAFETDDRTGIDAR